MLITVPSAERVIQCAMEVHRILGPGLFESVYERCLSREMSSAALQFCEQLALPVTYDGAGIRSVVCTSNPTAISKKEGTP